MGKACLVALWMSALALVCSADRVVLTDGRVVMGKIVAETDQKLTIQVSETIFTDIPRSKVAGLTRDNSYRVPSRLGISSGDSSDPASGPRDEKRQVVCIIQVQGLIETDLMVSAIRRSAARARELKADVAVFEIDTSGGRLDLTQEVCAEIERMAPTQTVAYVSGGAHGGAYSAGAMLALACNRIYMAPGTAIGAAAPLVIVLDPARRMAPAVDKAVSAITARMRSLAEKNGHPPELAGAMVDPEVELRVAMVDGRQTFLSVEKAVAAQTAGKAEPATWTHPKGKLLTLTAREAQRLGLASDVAASRRDLLAALGLAAARVIDLQTSKGLDDAKDRRDNHLLRLDAQIAVFASRARALDPAGYKYKRLDKRSGFRSPGDFEDEGQLWRQRGEACIEAADAFLAVARQKLVFARKFPEMAIDTKCVELLMQQMLALRERVASEHDSTGAER